MDKKRIVILGGGFGGLRVAMRLEKYLKKRILLDRYEIVLIDQYSYHTYTPLLYEVALSVESLPRRELETLVAYNLKELLRGRLINFFQERVTQADFNSHLVRTEKQALGFEYLIIALGSEVNYFGVPGVRENSLTLKSLTDALKIRDRISNYFFDDEKKCKIVVGGGGATGVELAAEAKNLMPWAEVNILEGSDSILNGCDKAVIKKAGERLTRLGVTVKTNFKISEVGTDMVLGADKESEPFDLFLWTAGVRAASFTTHLPVKKERGERVTLTEKFGCVPERSDFRVGDSVDKYGASKIYAIGDVACFTDAGTGKMAPLFAWVALQQAEVLAKNIFERIKKEEGLSRTARFYPYKYRELGYVVPVGGKFAVAKIGRFIFSGFAGWIVKGLVELEYLISIMPFFKAVRLWLRGLFVFIKNDRLG